jgi:hypothetical protein
MAGEDTAGWKRLSRCCGDLWIVEISSGHGRRRHTYLLVELSPSWEASSCAATQEIWRRHTAPQRLAVVLRLFILMNHVYNWSINWVTSRNTICSHIHVTISWQKWPFSFLNLYSSKEWGPEHLIHLKQPNTSHATNSRLMISHLFQSREKKPLHIKRDWHTTTY